MTRLRLTVEHGVLPADDIYPFGWTGLDSDGAVAPHLPPVPQAVGAAGRGDTWPAILGGPDITPTSDDKNGGTGPEELSLPCSLPLNCELPPGVSAPGM